MTNPYVKAAQAERADLLRQRQALDKRLEMLETFLNIAPTLPIPEEEPKKGGRAGKKEGGAPRRVYRNGTSAKNIVTDSALALLATREWVPTKDILAEAESRGAAINSVNKILRISSILTRQKQQFRAERGKGWSLKK